MDRGEPSAEVISEVLHRGAKDITLASREEIASTVLTWLAHNLPAELAGPMPPGNRFERLAELLSRIYWHPTIDAATLAGSWYDRRSMVDRVAREGIDFRDAFSIVRHATAVLRDAGHPARGYFEHSFGAKDIVQAVDMPTAMSAIAHSEIERKRKAQEKRAQRARAEYEATEAFQRAELDRAVRELAEIEGFAGPSW